MNAIILFALSCDYIVREILVRISVCLHSFKFPVKSPSGRIAFFVCFQNLRNSGFKLLVQSVETLTLRSTPGRDNMMKFIFPTQLYMI